MARIAWALNRCISGNEIRSLYGTLGFSHAHSAAGAVLDHFINCTGIGAVRFQQYHYDLLTRSAQAARAVFDHTWQPCWRWRGFAPVLCYPHNLRMPLLAAQMTLYSHRNQLPAHPIHPSPTNQPLSPEFLQCSYPKCWKI